MKIHEYQAKDIFAAAGIPIPKGRVAFTPQEVREIASEYGVPVMVKAQVHVGGRGKAGGIKYCKDPEEAFANAESILGMDIKGLQVRKVLVTEAVEIAHEAYVGIIVDRAVKRPVIMVSAAGGIDIEEVAARTPEKIHKAHVDPLTGLRMFEARNLAYRLYSNPKTAAAAAKVIKQLYECFSHVDASLVEINPLVTTPAGEVIALDAKINERGPPAGALVCRSYRQYRLCRQRCRLGNGNYGLGQASRRRAGQLSRHWRLFQPGESRDRYAHHFARRERQGYSLQHLRRYYPV
jgi:succinyl-CoA synthetase beta subunit